MRLRASVLSFLAASALSVAAAPSYAQKCEGPAELCSEVLQLREALDRQKQLVKEEAEKDATDVERARMEERAADDKRKEERMARIVAGAATIAVFLKILISILKAWRGYFRSDKSKAWLKVGLVGVGFLAFVLTNVGFGMPWWQALVLAGGGPGSILIHELGKMVPVLRGKKKYEEVDPDGDPTNQDSTDVEPNA